MKREWKKAAEKVVTGVVLSATVALASISSVSAEPVPVKELITIGTGGVTGVYYPTGGAICRLVNKSRKNHGIRCSTESTSGGVYNLAEIRKGELTMGVAQSDWLTHAYEGSSEFADAGADKNLRVLFAMHQEPFTVVARSDSGITTFDDIRGKRVNIGEEGSGHRGTLEALMLNQGMKKSDFAATSELKASAQASALCNNEIDVMIYAVGHPSGAVKEVTTSCDSRLVSVAGAKVDKLISSQPYYEATSIPGGLYRGNDNDIQTFGVKAIIVASEEMSDETAYTIVSSVFDNFDIFKKLHPAFANLKKDEMIEFNLDVPLHQGAERYYKEKGML